MIGQPVVAPKGSYSFNSQGANLEPVYTKQRWDIAKVLNLQGSLYCLFRFLPRMDRPDVTVLVDWALNTKLPLPKNGLKKSLSKSEALQGDYMFHTGVAHDTGTDAGRHMTSHQCTRKSSADDVILRPGSRGRVDSVNQNHTRAQRS